MSDPEPDRQPILASDAEREQAIVRLREAVGEGRLTLEEFSQRVDVAQTARTDTELATLSRDLPGPATAGPAAALTTTPDEHRATFSHLIRKGPWTLPARSSWRSLFGTIDLDLREARLADADSHLRVHNVFGTVTIVVPEGIEVDVRGGGPFASQKIDTPQRPPVAGGPRLTIDCSGPGGTLHVRSRPTHKDTIKALIKGE